jgi:hypothetical protein
VRIKFARSDAKVMTQNSLHESQSACLKSESLTLVPEFKFESSSGESESHKKGNRVGLESESEY